MATNYPGGLDSLTNPSAGDALTSPSHSAQHANANDAIEAVQTELGTDPSGSDATVAARLTAIEAGTNLGSGSVVEAKIADSAVTSAKIADGTIVNADINASAAIARSKISGLPTSSTDNTIVRFDSTAGAMQTSGVVIDDNNRLTVATGATGGYGFASGAVDLSGTGTPEGVVTAAPGSTWLQTDATTDVKGWIRWVKATGTGSTGWVAGPEADTGWRDVSGLMPAGFQTSNPNAQLFLRRVGSRISWLLNENSAGSATGGVTLYDTIPTGFRPSPSNPGVGAAQCFDPNSGLPLSQSLYALGSTLYGFGWTAVRHFAQLTYVTNDAWPSSLPGSAA